MRLSTFALPFLFALLADAQYPSCANPCIENANLGGCVASDTACLCKNSAFVNNVTACIYADCSGSDLNSAISTAQQICDAVGVTLTSSPVSTSTGSQGNNTATRTSSGSATAATNSKSGASSITHINTLSAASVLGLVALSLSFL